MLSNGPIVIKYGGSLLEDPMHRQGFLKDVAALSGKEKVILVHGGGKEITRALEAQGLPARFVKGLRVTDEATMKVVEEVLGQVNQGILKQLAELGVRAEGYSGRTEHLLRATAIPELGRVGRQAVVNVAVFGNILRKRTLPVFYSVGEDTASMPLNINADDFALALALACGAKRLVFLTDTGGIVDSVGQKIPRIDRGLAEELIQKGVITGGMVVKAQASVDAVEKGVGSVDITKNIKYLIDAKDSTGDATHFSVKAA